MSISLLSLLQLSDPALPIGGYAHSLGLETYVQQGIVHNSVTAAVFVAEMLSRSLRYTDAAFASLAFDSSAAGDFEGLLRLDDECSAVKLPMETRQASQKLGNRLMKIFQPVIQDDLVESYRQAISSKQAAGHYCLAFGIHAHAFGIDKQAALSGLYYNAAASMVTNCVKLVPLGQVQGQQLLFSMQDLLVDLVNKSMVPDRELVGLCCAGFDIRCMQHERLYSRLYMS